MCLQLNLFSDADWELAQRVLQEPTLSCVRLLHKRTDAELLVAKLAYGHPVWVNRRLVIGPTDGVQLPEKPVGLVLSGALEVTENFVYKGKARCRPTKILRPGDFFGLFEAIGDLYGFWQITAGVQCFLVTNPLGDIRLLKKKGWNNVSPKQLWTFKHLTKADFDYSELVRFAEARQRGEHAKGDPWTCTFMLFDLASIEDSEAELTLLRAAVSQLASLVRQNPPDSLFEKSAEAGEKAEIARVAATLDAILSDHIPVLTLYRAGTHDEYGPFGQVVETLREFLVPASKAGSQVGSQTPVHLWIPDIWSRAVPPVALYLDALAGRFDMDTADQLLTNPRPLRSGTVITRLDNPGDPTYRARVRTQEGNEAIFERITVHRQKNRIPKEVHGQLFSLAEAAYGWPLHLGRGFLLRGAT